MAIFILLFFAGFISLFVGIISPRKLERFFRTSSRLKVTLINVAIIFFSFIMVGVTADTSSMAIDEDSTDVEVLDEVQKILDIVEDDFLQDIVEQKNEIPLEPNEVASNNFVESETPIITEPANNDSGTQTHEEIPIVEETTTEPAPQEPEVTEPQPEPPTVPQTTPTTYTCDCSTNTKNCSDFTTHTEAQAYYECCMDQVGYDVHRLDGSDNDGLACESL